jgi:hypothetical protein
MKVLQIISKIFLALGAFILLVYLAFFLSVAYQFMREPVVDFDDGDLQYVLEWLGQERDPAQLLHSFHPPTNWAGDTEKMFALQLEATIIPGLLGREGVVRGDQLPEDLQRAVSFAMNFTRDLNWFPTEEKILTADYYVSPIRIVMQGGYPDSTDLLVIHPQRRLLYFVAAKM